MATKWTVNQYINKQMKKMTVFLRDKELAIEGMETSLVQLKDVKRIHIGKSPRIFSIVVQKEDPIVLEAVDVNEVKSMITALVNALDAMQRKPEEGMKVTQQKLESLKEGDQLNIRFGTQNSVSFANFTRTLSKSTKSNSRSESKKSSKSQSRKLSRKSTLKSSASNSGKSSKKSSRSNSKLSSRHATFHLQRTQHGGFDFDDGRKKWKLAKISQFGRKTLHVHLKKVGSRKWEIWDEKKPMIKVEEIQRIFIGKTTDVLMKSRKCQKVPQKRFFTIQTEKGDEFNFEEQERGAKNNLILTLLRNVNYPTIKETKNMLMNLSSKDTMQIRLNAGDGWTAEQYDHKSKKKVNITVDVANIILVDEMKRKTKKIKLDQIHKIYVGRCTDLLKTHSDAKSKPQYLFFSIITRGKESYDFKAQHQLDQNDIIHQIFMNMTFHGLKPKGGSEQIHQKLSNLQRHETLKISVITDKERRKLLLRSATKINAVWKGFKFRRSPELKKLRTQAANKKNQKPVLMKTKTQQIKLQEMTQRLKKLQSTNIIEEPEDVSKNQESTKRELDAQKEKQNKANLEAERQRQNTLKEMKAERKRLDISRREITDAVREMRVVRQRLEESRVMIDVVTSEMKAIKKQNETRAIEAELRMMEERLVDQENRLTFLKEGQQPFQQKEDDRDA